MFLKKNKPLFLKERFLSYLLCKLISAMVKLDGVNICPSLEHFV